MFDQKKEITPPGGAPKGNSEIIDEKNVAIHTMQEDLDALSGIFPKKESTSRDATTFAKKDLIEKGQSAPHEQYFNPFLDKQAALTPEKQQKIANFAQKNNVPAAPLPPFSPAPASAKKPDAAIENREAPMTQAAPKSSFHRVIWVLVIILVVIAFSLGGYYYWMMRKSPSAETANVPQPAENTTQPEAPSQNVIVEPIPKYLVDKPNYLSLNVSSPTYDDFKKTVTTVASELKAAGIAVPVEFILTNEKNEQISFVEFLLISKVELPSDVVKNLGNTFSLFIQEGPEGTRLGLSVQSLDATSGGAAMRKGEATIVKGLSSLFLDSVTIPTGAKVFKTNTYRNADVRYFNLANDASMAIDYAFVGSELMIGTSKNNMLAIMDRASTTSSQE